MVKKCIKEKLKTYTIHTENRSYFVSCLSDYILWISSKEKESKKKKKNKKKKKKHKTTKTI